MPRACQFGVGRADLDLPDRGQAAGYSVLGGRVGALEPSEPRLTATAVALVDTDGRRAILVHADLHSAGDALRRAVLRRCPGVRPEELAIAATHTHLGPGFLYGAPLFDALTTARPWPLPVNADRLAGSIAAAVLDALHSLTPGGAAWHEIDVPGVASNRSLAALIRNPPSLLDAFATGPGRAAASLPAEADRWVDPRLRLLVVGPLDGPPRAALAWFSCHGTALGADWPRWSAEWAGHAREHVERARDLRLGLASAATGDTSPLPLDPDGAIRTSTPAERPNAQGEPLARWVGQRVGQAAIIAIDRVRPESFQVATATTRWRPGDDRLKARYGLATLGGAIDGAKGVDDGPWALYARGVDAEGYAVERAYPIDDPQHPKVDASHHLTGSRVGLGSLVGALAPRSLPLHVIRIGDGALATVPGEPTTLGAYTIERRLLAATGLRRVIVGGYAGTYAGYWSTPEEYDQQRYEGASTLYGRDSLTHLGARLVALAASLPPTRPPS